jgi:hypothetical protein
MRTRAASVTNAAVTVLLLAAAPPSSLGGPLSETARGIDNKVETHTESDSAPPPSNPDPSPPPRYDDDCTSCAPTTVVVASGSSYAGYGGGASEPILTGPGRLDLYAGAHSVVGSDSAVVGELRASKDWIGLGVSGIRYVEHVEEGKREDNVSLYLTAFTISGRVLALGPTELWLDGGMAVTGSSEYATILGTAWSVRGEHDITPDLGLRGQVRYYALEHDVTAWEGWAGVRAWFLQAGYRALQFNVGPPLHGPEAGVALRF